MKLQCADVTRFVDLYLDNEFIDEERVKLEAHLETCASCKALVDTQARWRERILAATPYAKASDTLRARIAAKLDDADADQRSAGRRRTLLAFAMPAAAACVVIVALGTRASNGRLPPASVASASLPAVTDVVAKHSRNLPIEVSSSKEDELRQWYADKVSFPVRPPHFNNSNASLRGGRLANLQDRDAAYLVYDVNGNKVSVLMFDPSEMPTNFDGQDREHIGNRDVTVQQDHGYNVAVFEDNGVGYAITSDMDKAGMVKLISAVGH